MSEYIIEWSGIGARIVELIGSVPPCLIPKRLREERLREEIVRCRDCVHYTDDEMEYSRGSTPRSAAAGRCSCSEGGRRCNRRIIGVYYANGACTPLCLLQDPVRAPAQSADSRRIIRMPIRPTTPEKACADLIRKGICLMECIGSGKRWCDAVVAMVDEGGKPHGR